MAKTPPPPIALGKLDLEEKTLEVKLRFKGKAAQDIADYQRAYQAAHGSGVEAEPLILNIVQGHIDGDKGFQAWRKANPAS